MLAARYMFQDIPPELQHFEVSLRRSTGRGVQQGRGASCTAPAAFRGPPHQQLAAAGTGAPTHAINSKGSSMRQTRNPCAEDGDSWQKKEQLSSMVEELSELVNCMDTGLAQGKDRPVKANELALPLRESYSTLIMQVIPCHACCWTGDAAE
jgi:hypothetical protein